MFPVLSGWHLKLNSLASVSLMKVELSKRSSSVQLPPFITEVTVPRLLKRPGSTWVISYPGGRRGAVFGTLTSDAGLGNSAGGLGRLKRLFETRLHAATISSL